MKPKHLDRLDRILQAAEKVLRTARDILADYNTPTRNGR